MSLRGGPLLAFARKQGADEAISTIRKAEIAAPSRRSGSQ
jgi:hypothetical protein